VRKILAGSLALLLVAAIIALIFGISERLRFSAIVIHHTASEVDNYHSIAAYQQKEHGWRDAAYHLILSNGSTAVPAGFLEATGRYRYLSPSVATKSVYYNLRAIHICVVGNYDRHEMPAGLRAALADTVRQLQQKYGIADDQVLFHRDCSSSSCPGRFVTKEKLQQWLAADAARCPLAVRLQHEKIIGQDWEVIALPARLAAAALGFAKTLIIKHADIFQPA
jgi:hypothetical protein